MDKALKKENQIFDVHRFMRLVKSYFMLNKSYHLKLSMAVVCSFMFFAVLISIIAVNNLSEIARLEDAGIRVSFDVKPGKMHDVAKTLYSAYYAFISCFVATLAISIFGSLTFHSMSTKQSRISALMAPASMAEKFWMQAIIHTVGGTVVIILGWLIGCLILRVSFGGTWLLEDILDDFAPNAKSLAFHIFALVVLTFYFWNSIYALGSAFWPKLSWLKTWLAITVVQWLVGILMMSSTFLMDFDLDYFGEHIDDESFLRCCILMVALLTVGCWTAAWFRFRNTQIVQRFMMK